MFKAVAIPLEVIEQAIGHTEAQERLSYKPGTGLLISGGRICR